MMIKIEFWSYTVNGGDGSAYPFFFESEKQAEDYAERHNERFTEDIRRHEFSVEVEHGIIIEGLHNQ